MKKIAINSNDFGGMPLLKKYAMFDSGLVPMERYRRDMYRFDAVALQSLRVDLFIGENGVAFGDLVSGDGDDIKYDFRELDELCRMLSDHGILPYMSWCYIPKPLQTEDDFRSGPSDLNKYAEILEHFAAHYKEQGIRLGYQEVYNEPDCFDVFFKGKYEDYIRMYEVGAPALRRGDPDAVVGGPSTAFVFNDRIQKENLTSFLASVLEKRLPLDFFSFHSYGFEEKVYCKRTKTVRELLGDEPYFKTTELHMNELNAVQGPWGYETAGGRLLCDRRMLTLVFNAVRDLSEYTDLTLVHWAQLLDSGVDALGLVDKYGNVRPGYAAFEIYERMPVRRIRTGQYDGFDIMASADSNRISVLIWGVKTNGTEIGLCFSDVSFDDAVMSVYHLNEAFFEGYDGHLMPDSEAPLANTNIMHTLDTDDVLYIEINSQSVSETSENMDENGHKYVRTHYYFDDRNKNTVSFYDEQRSVTYLGMGDNDSGLAVCASELDVEGNTLSVKVKSDIGGESASLGIRIDFMTESGYESSVLYTNMPDADLPDMPFGTGRKADRVKCFDGEELTLDLTECAPEKYNGRINVTCILKDGGRDGWAEIRIR